MDSPSLSLRSLIKDVGAYWVGSALSPLVSLALLPLYTRFITPHEYGLMAVVMVTGSVLGTFAFLGLASALVRLWWSDLERGEVFYTALGLTLAATLTAGLGLAALSPAFAHWLTPQDPRAYLFLLLGLTIPAEGLVNLLFAALRASRRAWSFTGGSALRAALTVGLVFLLLAGLKRGVEGIFEARLLALLGTALALAPTSIPKGKPRLSRRAARELLKFGLAIVPGNAADWVLTMADRYFLGFMRNLAEAGLYSVGYRVAGAVNPLLLRPTRQALPPFVYQAAHSDEELAKAKLAQVSFLYILLGGFALVASASWAGPALRLLATPKYFGAEAVVPWVVLGYLLFGTTWVMSAGLLIIKKPYWITIGLYLGAGANLLLNWLLVPRWGMMGAAWATAASYGLAAIWSFAFSQRLWPVRHRWLGWGLVAAWTGLLLYLNRFLGPWTPLLYPIIGLTWKLKS